MVENPNDLQCAELSTDELMYVEMRVNNETKSVLVAYLIWVFLGFLGVHNLYLASYGLAIFQGICGGIVLPATVYSTLQGEDASATTLLVVLTIWGFTLVMDIFFIPIRAKRHQTQLRARLSREIANKKARRAERFIARIYPYSDKKPS